jgi:hypothetical protein
MVFVVLLLVVGDLPLVRGPAPLDMGGLRHRLIKSLWDHDQSLRLVGSHILPLGLLGLNLLNHEVWCHIFVLFGLRL